jgi:hypothetical protein
VVNATTRPIYHRERDPLPVLQEAGWASGSVWTHVGKRKSFAYTGIRIPNGSASIESLYRIRYSNPTFPTDTVPNFTTTNNWEKLCLYALVTFKEASYVWQNSQCVYIFRLLLSELMHSVWSLQTATTNASTLALVRLRKGETDFLRTPLISAHHTVNVYFFNIPGKTAPSHAQPSTVPYAGSHCWSLTRRSFQNAATIWQHETHWHNLFYFVLCPCPILKNTTFRRKSRLPNDIKKNRRWTK